MISRFVDRVCNDLFVYGLFCGAVTERDLLTPCERMWWRCPAPGQCTYRTSHLLYQTAAGQ